MESFKAQETPTEANNFKPYTTLPEHLVAYEQFGVKSRKEMIPSMQTLAGLTDIITLRSAAPSVTRPEAANDEVYNVAA